MLEDDRGMFELNAVRLGSLTGIASNMLSILNRKYRTPGFGSYCRTLMVRRSASKPQAYVLDRNLTLLLLIRERRSSEAIGERPPIEGIPINHVLRMKHHDRSRVVTCGRNTGRGSRRPGGRPSVVKERYSQNHCEAMCNAQTAKGNVLGISNGNSNDDGQPPESGPPQGRFATESSWISHHSSRCSALAIPPTGRHSHLSRQCKPSRNNGMKEQRNRCVVQVSLVGKRFSWCVAGPQPIPCPPARERSGFADLSMPYRR